MQNQSENPYNLLHLISVIYRWRKQIGIFVLGATLLTAVISLLIPNYYTARATFAPSNEERLGGKNNSLYGDADAVDRALIFAESSPLVDFMIAEFKLAERYGIDASTAKGEYKVAKRFRKLYKVKKNAHSGIEISVEDTDPVVAAEMISKVLYRIEQMNKETTKPNKELLSETYELSLKQKAEEVKLIMDSLAHLRQYYQIYDPLRQGELLSELVLNSEAALASDRAKLNFYQEVGQRDSVRILQGRIQGNEERLRVLKSDSASSSINTKTYAQGADLISYYQNRLLHANQEVFNIHIEYDRFKVQANTQASSIIVLEAVQVPKIKSYPTRSIIVLAVGFLALFIALVAAILLDSYRKIDWKAILNDEDSPDNAQ